MTEEEAVGYSLVFFAAVVTGFLVIGAVALVKWLL